MTDDDAPNAVVLKHELDGHPELGTADKPLANATNGNHHVNPELIDHENGDQNHNRNAGHQCVDGVNTGKDGHQSVGIRKGCLTRVNTEGKSDKDDVGGLFPGVHRVV